jgi:hypothetical protein
VIIVTQILYSGQPSHDGDHKIFGVMTSLLPKGTVDYRSPSYLNIRIEIDSEGRLRTRLYDKRDDFNFPIVKFPFMRSTIPAAPS